MWSMFSCVFSWGTFFHFVFIPFVILFLLNYWSINRFCVSNECLVGKTAVVTGGSKGIGYEISLGLAARGCKVIIGCRTTSNRIIEEMQKITNNPNITIKHLDLLSIDSVRNFAKDLNSNEKCIDILINNAGISKAHAAKTPDGLNPLMQANYFGHFLLTHLLIDLIKKSPGGRIIFVSSVFAYFNNLTVENLNSFYNSATSTWLTDLNLYGNSKACQIIAAVMLSEKLKLTNISVNAVHPGFVYTALFDDVFRNPNVNKMFLFCFYSITYQLSKTTQQGAQPILKLAISKYYRNFHGCFIWDLDWLPLPHRTRDRELCKQIWHLSEELVGLSQHEKI